MFLSSVLQQVSGPSLERDGVVVVYAQQERGKEPKSLRPFTISK